MDELLFQTSLNILRTIQENNYDILKNKGALDKVSKEYIISVLENYGGILNSVNEKEYRKYFQYVQIKNKNKYVTYLDLIIDEKRSDLTLICEIELRNQSVTKILVDDIHVL